MTPGYVSATVGTSGNDPTRLVPVTASAFNVRLPECAAARSRWACRRVRRRQQAQLANSGASRLKGIWTISMPASAFGISIVRCCGLADATRARS